MGDLAEIESLFELVICKRGGFWPRRERFVHGGFRRGVGVDRLDSGGNSGCINGWFLDVMFVALENVVVGQYMRKLGG